MDEDRIQDAIAAYVSKIAPLGGIARAKRLSPKRRKEIAIRLSLGATHWQLLRQMLTESMVLSLLGCGAGMLVAQWVNRLLLALKPGDLELVEQRLAYR